MSNRRQHGISYTEDLHGDITSLRVDGVSWIPIHESFAMARGARRNAEMEIERLTHWKAEAMAILDEWEEVWKALGSPGGLGESKARASRAKAAELMAGGAS